MEIRHKNASHHETYKCLKEDCNGTIEFHWIDNEENNFGGFCDKCDTDYDQYPTEWIIKSIDD